MEAATTGNGERSSSSDINSMLAIFAVGGALLALMILVVIMQLYMRRRNCKPSTADEEVTEFDNVDNLTQSGLNEAAVVEGGEYAEVDRTQPTQADNDTYQTLGETALPEVPQGQIYNKPNAATDRTQSVLYGSAQQSNHLGHDAHTALRKEMAKSQSTEPEENTADICCESAEACYSSVSIKSSGEKETVRYDKNMVDNVLYGST